MKFTRIAAILLVAILSGCQQSPQGEDTPAQQLVARIGDMGCGKFAKTDKYPGMDVLQGDTLSFENVQWYRPDEIPGTSKLQSVTVEVWGKINTGPLDDKAGNATWVTISAPEGAADRAHFDILVHEMSSCEQVQKLHMLPEEYSPQDWDKLQRILLPAGFNIYFHPGTKKDILNLLMIKAEFR